MSWPTREAVVSAVGARMARLLLATVRLRLDDRAGFTTAPPPFPVIITFWHNRIPAITLCYLRRYHSSRKGVVVLTSPSRDGEILARVMAAFRMGSVRGSSNKRASRALVELEARLHAGYDLAITPDGPRGPKYVLSPGPVYLAQATGARILLAHARYGRAIRLNSWDAFRIPMPFSTVSVTLAPYEFIPATATGDDFERERKRIEGLLRAGAD